MNEAAFRAIIATLAWKQADDDYAHVPSPDCETFANEAGWPRAE